MHLKINSDSLGNRKLKEKCINNTVMFNLLYKDVVLVSFHEKINWPEKSESQRKHSFIIHKENQLYFKVYVCLFFIEMKHMTEF